MLLLLLLLSRFSRVQLCGIPWTAAPGSSVHGIFQARVLEWVAIAFSKITVYMSFKKYYSDIIKIGHKRFYFMVKFFKHKYPSSPWFMKQNSEI